MKRNRLIVVSFLLIALWSCKNENNTKNDIREIEKLLGIVSDSSNTIQKRLSNIRESIVEIKSANKYAFGAYQRDTIQLGESYRANFVLAQSRPNDRSYLVLTYNKRQDTIYFNKDFNIYDIKIDPSSRGHQVYGGYIFNTEDSTKYPFEMAFYVK